MSKEAYLDEVLLQSKMIAHLTEKSLHALSATSDGPHETPESGESSPSGCSVNSWSRAELSFGPLQRVDGDYLDGYHSHKGLYSVTMYVVLSLALTRQLVQMTDATRSVPLTSELLLHGLLQ